MKKYLYIVAGLLALIGLVIFLRAVFAGNLQLKQSFGLGPLQIHYYGLFMAGAIAAGYVLAHFRARAYKLTVAAADSIIFNAVILGFVGARLYHIFSELGYYLQHPSYIPQVWRGGLSIYGAVIGGAAGVVWYVWRHTPAGARLKTILADFDWLAPSVALGQVIGRFGNFFNYELFGYPTALPWKMYVPLRFRPERFLSSAYFHPLFLYEALAVVAILAFLLLAPRLVKSKTAWLGRPGTLFFSYIFLYNIARFILEFLRIDSVFVGALRINALVSLILTAAALVCLGFNFFSHDRQVPSDN